MTVKGSKSGFLGIRRVPWFLLALLLLVLTLFAFLAIGMIILVVMRQENSSEPMDERQLYKYLELRAQDNFTHSGFLRLSKQIDQFMFYRSDDTYSLISEFGANAYECQGSCSCMSHSQYSNDRRIAISLPSSLIYLVAAVTSIIAYNLAEEYFKEECQNQLQDSCSSPDNTIVTEVDYCENVITSDETSSGETSPDETKSLPEVKPTRKKKPAEDFVLKNGEYTCTGSCLPLDPCLDGIRENGKAYSERVNTKLRNSFDKSMASFLDGNEGKECHTMSITTEETVKHDKEFPFQDNMHALTVNDLQVRFIFHRLNEFCRGESFAAFEFDEDFEGYPINYLGRVLEGYDEYSTPVCSGYDLSVYNEVTHHKDFTERMDWSDFWVMEEMAVNEAWDYTLWRSKNLNPSVACVKSVSKRRRRRIPKTIIFE